MRNYFIAGNWKMNTTLPKAEQLAAQIVQGVEELQPLPQVRIGIFPPFISLAGVHTVSTNTRVEVGAQNCSNELSGAFTGEISVDMLQSVGCTAVLIGHSERRTIYKESNEFIASKVQRVLASSVLTPVLCIGETLSQRQNNQTWDVLRNQIDDVYSTLEKKDAERIIIAYEPVWAIGTGIAATPEEAQEAHSFIRNHCSRFLGVAAQDAMLLYGGSVTAENAQSLLSQPDINGALIGGASLKAEAFLRIIATANALSQ